MISIPSPIQIVHDVQVSDRPQFSIEKDFTPHQPEPLEEATQGPSEENEN